MAAVARRRSAPWFLRLLLKHSRKRLFHTTRPSKARSVRCPNIIFQLCSYLPTSQGSFLYSLCTLKACPIDPPFPILLRLVEVGKFDTPKQEGQYEIGQVFIDAALEVCTVLNTCPTCMCLHTMSHASTHSVTHVRTHTNREAELSLLDLILSHSNIVVPTCSPLSPSVLHSPRVWVPGGHIVPLASGRLRQRYTQQLCH